MTTKKLLSVLIGLSTVLLAAEPVFRVGVMSDTHVTRDLASCSILKDAFELFKQHKVEVIINAGDIADVYHPQAYRNYRKTFNDVFRDAKNAPREIFAYAYHDIIGYKGATPWDAFKDVQKYLEAKNAPYDIVRHKGYIFLVMPQYHDTANYRKQLEAAEKERGGKPFFIVDHVPLHDTVDVSLNGNSEAKKLVEKHPAAIHISGHNHSLLANELNIWQGSFTAVNAGFLHGSMPVKKSCDMAMIMEIYQDKIIMRRFFTDSKKEYLSGTAPWVIPLPFDMAAAPYSAENRLKNSETPAFPAKAQLKVAFSEKGAEVKFPHAVKKLEISRYEFELARKVNGTWQNLAYHKKPGPYSSGAKNIGEYGFHTFSTGYFDFGKVYRVKVTPVHFSGKKGAPVSAEFKANKKSTAQVVFESRNPMQECPMTSGITGKNNYVKAGKENYRDGFFLIGGEKITAKMHFPAEVWNGKAGGRFIVDMQTEFAPDRSLHLQLRCLSPKKYIPQYILTQQGNNAVTRYVIDFKPFNRDDYNFYFNMKNAGPGKVKINYIRIERYNNRIEQKESSK